MKLAALIALLSASIAHANLIDLTPGGFNLVEPWPDPVAQFFEQIACGTEFLAGANINGNQVYWSPFTIFGDDHFDIDPNGTTLESDGTLSVPATSRGTFPGGRREYGPSLRT
jgi:hypothetical protein